MARQSKLDRSGMPQLRSSDRQRAPYYMEAELNSPMIRLEPSASRACDTRWHPVPADKSLQSIGSAGVIESPLTAVCDGNELRLSGRFGVFFRGSVSDFVFDFVFDNRGGQPKEVLGAVDPPHAVRFDQTIPVAPGDVQVALQVDDQRGSDLGVLGEVAMTRPRRAC